MVVTVAAAVDRAFDVYGDGAEHLLVRDWGHFQELLHGPPERGIRVLEVRTDRKRDAAYRKKLFAELAEVAAAAMGTQRALSAE